MKKMKNSLSMLIILALVITAMASLSPVTASPITTLNVEPAAIASGSSSPVDVKVTVTDVTDLFGYEFKLLYDTSTVTAISITPGSFFPTPNAYPDDGNAWLLKKEINDTVGYVWYAVVLDAGTTSGETGDGILATITFTVTGGSLLGLVDTALSDSNGDRIPYVVIDSLKPMIALNEWKIKVNRASGIGIGHKTYNDTENLLEAYAINTGTLNVNVQVIFEVEDAVGTVTPVKTDFAPLPAGQSIMGAPLSATWTTSEPGTYFITAYLVYGLNYPWMDGGCSRTLTLTVLVKLPK